MRANIKVKLEPTTDRPSHASPMFNPKAIRSHLTLSSLTPQSKGTLTIARLIEATNASPSNPYDNPYAVITPPTPQLIVQASCSGVRIDDKNPSFDREVPGSIDKTIYRCLVDDTTENRSIVAGMLARIVRSDGWIIEGVIDLVQYRTTGGIRIYIDASQNTGIDWNSIVFNDPSPSAPSSMLPSGSSIYSEIYTAAIDIEPFRVVYLDANRLLRYADSRDVSTAFNVIGISFQSIVAGSQGQVITRGEYTNPMWAWQTNMPIFLGMEGMLIQQSPVEGFILTIANAVSTNRIDIRIQEPVVLD